MEIEDLAEYRSLNGWQLSNTAAAALYPRYYNSDLIREFSFFCSQMCYIKLFFVNLCMFTVMQHLCV